MLDKTRPLMAFVLFLLVLYALMIFSGWRFSTQALASGTHQEALVCEDEVVVQVGDRLWKLAEKFYGEPLAFPAIVAATNARAAADDSFPVIEDADLILPGWKLCIPGAEEAQAILAAGNSIPTPTPTPTGFPTPTPTGTPTRTPTPTPAPAGQIVTLAENLQAYGSAAATPFSFLAGEALELIGQNDTRELLLVADPVRPSEPLGWIANDEANFSKPPDLDRVPVIPAPPSPTPEASPPPEPTPTPQAAATPTREVSVDTGQMEVTYLAEMIVDRPGKVTVEIRPEQLLASLENLGLSSIPSVITIEESSRDGSRVTFEETIILFPVMEARLIAPDFEISGDVGTEARRPLTSATSQIATWTWTVTPKMVGPEQPITIEIIGRIDNSENTLPFLVRSITRNVDVQDKPLISRILAWLGDNILTILSTGGPLALLIAYSTYRAGRKSDKLEQSIKELQEKLKETESGTG